MFGVYQLRLRGLGRAGRGYSVNKKWTGENGRSVNKIKALLTFFSFFQTAEQLGINIKVLITAAWIWPRRAGMTIWRSIKLLTAATFFILIFPTAETIGDKIKFVVLPIPAVWIRPCRAEVNHTAKCEGLTRNGFYSHFPNDGNDWE